MQENVYKNKKYRGLLPSPVYGEPTKKAWIGLTVDTCHVSSLGSRRSTRTGHDQNTFSCPPSSRTSRVLLPILGMREIGLVSAWKICDIRESFTKGN